MVFDTCKLASLCSITLYILLTLPLIKCKATTNSGLTEPTTALVIANTGENIGETNFKTTFSIPPGFSTDDESPGKAITSPALSIDDFGGWSALEEKSTHDMQSLDEPVSINDPAKSATSLPLPDSTVMNSSTKVAQTTTTTTTTTTLPLKEGLLHNQLTNLLDSVLLDYDRRIRPRNDQSRYVEIFSDFVPFSIINYNTQEQKFSVMGYFKVDWRDDFLTWDRNMYEGTGNLRIPIQSIWIPKLVVDKTYDGKALVGDMQSDIALISSRGYVRWFPEGIYSVPCQVRMRFYPFDIQTCKLTYYIRDEDNSTINLKHDGTVDLTEYSENAEWKLNSLTATREQLDNKFVVTYTFTVERRGGFAMFTLIVPVLMLSTLSGATFLIPIETGEKCSFSVTIFLAYGIFETVVIDTLPHNSMDISYFIVYITSLLTVSVLLTVYTIVQAKIFHAFGDRHFTFCRKGKQGEDLSWAKFLLKLDTYAFVVFVTLITGFTAIFIVSMGENFDLL